MLVRLKFAEICVLVDPEMDVPKGALIEGFDPNPLPLIVTLTEEPLCPTLGEIDEIDGVGSPTLNEVVS